MLAIAGQTAGPNWSSQFLREPMGIPGVTEANNFKFKLDAPAFQVLNRFNVNGYISRRIPDFVYLSQIIIQIHGIQLGLYPQY